MVETATGFPPVLIDPRPGESIEETVERGIWLAVRQGVTVTFADGGFINPDNAKAMLTPDMISGKMEKMSAEALAHEVKAHLLREGVKEMVRLGDELFGQGILPKEEPDNFNFEI